MQDSFGEALALADTIYLPPAHRADKLGADSFDSVGIAKTLQSKGRQAWACDSHESLLEKLISDSRSATKPRLVVFFSNGSFGGIIQKFAQALK